ncbi:hypothetical protein AVEN_121165-1 [Araneus ventricosus]|uniref:Uncharacterized protein n=1 Tax=Araneus ventricosus TaxID=182803 RepID=A0A4Y2E1Z7_ARAVE|nr:hypothetical protein AVEN_121165-1 [Araneus ventricosus]
MVKILRGEVKVVKPHIGASPLSLNSRTKWPHAIFPDGAMTNADGHHRSTLRAKKNQRGFHKLNYSKVESWQRRKSLRGTNHLLTSSMRFSIAPTIGWKARNAEGFDTGHVLQYLLPYPITAHSHNNGAGGSDIQNRILLLLKVFNRKDFATHHYSKEKKV